MKNLPYYYQIKIRGGNPMIIKILLMVMFLSFLFMVGMLLISLKNENFIENNAVYKILMGSIFAECSSMFLLLLCAAGNFITKMILL